MATRLQNTIALATDTMNSLSSYENWTSFLRCAAWQYKYSFVDKVFIYAQRPDATACATMELWNNRTRRWVNAHSRGIGLLRRQNGISRLEFVFDISDTNSFYGHEVTLWEYHSRHNDAIRRVLSRGKFIFFQKILY